MDSEARFNKPLAILATSMGALVVVYSIFALALGGRELIHWVNLVSGAFVVGLNATALHRNKKVENQRVTKQ